MKKSPADYRVEINERWLVFAEIVDLVGVIACAVIAAINTDRPSVFWLCVLFFLLFLASQQLMVHAHIRRKD